MSLSLQLDSNGSKTLDLHNDGYSHQNLLSKIFSSRMLTSAISGPIIPEIDRRLRQGLAQHCYRSYQ